MQEGMGCKETSKWVQTQISTDYVRKVSWRREWLPTPVFLPGKSHGQRSLLGYSPCSHKELDTTERLTYSMEITRVKIMRIGLIFLLNNLRNQKLKFQDLKSVSLLCLNSIPPSLDPFFMSLPFLDLQELLGLCGGKRETPGQRRLCQ